MIDTSRPDPFQDADAKKALSELSRYEPHEIDEPIFRALGLYGDTGWRPDQMNADTRMLAILWIIKRRAQQQRAA